MSIIKPVNPGEFDRLLTGARTGDEWAWTQLYGEFAGPVLGYLRTRGAAEPEDLLGEVFLQVARQLGSFSGDIAGFRSWIFTIAHARLIDERRARTRHLVEPVAELEPEPTGGDPAEMAVDLLMEENITRMIKGLTPDQRDVLLLRIMGGLTIDEIAGILGKTTGAVKALQRRGLHNLERSLREGVPL